MKRIALIVAGFATVALGIALVPSPALAGGGNGAPSGSHYNLNIIGVPNGKSALLTGTSGKSLFVPLTGNCKINLQLGSFDVIDRNCTDDGQALFQLPNPDVNNTGTTTYSVYARALGKPLGTSTTRTCFTLLGSALLCSTYVMTLTRPTGRRCSSSSRSRARCASWRRPRCSCSPTAARGWSLSARTRRRSSRSTRRSTGNGCRRSASQRPMQSLRPTDSRPSRPSSWSG